MDAWSGAARVPWAFEFEVRSENSALTVVLADVFAMYAARFRKTLTGFHPEPAVGPKTQLARPR